MDGKNNNSKRESPLAKRNSELSEKVKDLTRRLSSIVEQTGMVTEIVNSERPNNNIYNRNENFECESQLVTPIGNYNGFQFKTEESEQNNCGQNDLSDFGDGDFMKAKKNADKLNINFGGDVNKLGESHLKSPVCKKRSFSQNEIEGDLEDQKNQTNEDDAPTGHPQRGFKRANSLINNTVSDKTSFGYSSQGSETMKKIKLPKKGCNIIKDIIKQTHPPQVFHSSKMLEYLKTPPIPESLELLQPHTDQGYSSYENSPSSGSMNKSQNSDIVEKKLHLNVPRAEDFSNEPSLESDSRNEQLITLESETCLTQNTKQFQFDKKVIL